MKTTRLSLITQFTLLTLLAACNAGKPVANRGDTAPLVLGQRLAGLATGPQGFVCEGSDTYRACACVEGAAGKWTCRGMASMCKTVGAGTPRCADGVCMCEMHM